jgi:hypothetical protein
MHPTRRCAGALAVAILTLTPISCARAMPPAAGNTVLLRYRFVPGQTYAYRLAMNTRMNITGVPASASNQTVTMGSIVRYHILRVDASGSADAEVRLSEATMSTTTGGRTTTTRLASPRPSLVHIGANGSMREAVGEAVGSTISAYDLNVVGTLPAGAVAPGARWTSTVVADLPSTLGTSLAPIHMTTQNVFSRYLQFDGQRVAAIDSTGTLQYITDTSLGGTPVHLHLTARMTGQSLFGLAVHRTVASQEHLDQRMFMSGRTSTGTSTAVHMHLVMSVSLSPYGR